MNGKYLENVKFYQNWNTLAGALHGVVDHFGGRFTRSQITGMSSLAFRLHMTPDCHPCQNIFDLNNWINNIAPVFGVHFDMIMNTPDDGNWDKTVKTTLNRIIETLDNNPVVYYDPALYEWYLITGYDNDSNEFTVTGTDGEYTIPADEIGENEDNPMLWCLFPTAVERNDNPERFNTCLTWAVNHYFHETPGADFADSGLTYGMNAWNLWTDTLNTGKADVFGLAHNLRTVRAAREDVWNFLNFLYENLDTYHTPAVENAINSCYNTVQNLLKAEDLYPVVFWTDNTVNADDPWTKKALNYIRQAGDWERKTFENLKNHLNENTKTNSN